MIVAAWETDVRLRLETDWTVRFDTHFRAGLPMKVKSIFGPTTLYDVAISTL